MENATKALIMAATVLISILLISFLVLFLRKGASASAEYHNTMSDAELAKFNSQFEVYDRKNNTYFDVITVLNLAYSINKTNENDSQNQISIEVLDEKKNKTDYYIDNSSPHSVYYISGNNNIQENIYSLVKDYTVLIDATKGKNYKYLFKCTSVKYNDTTGKVNFMKFELVEN